MNPLAKVPSIVQQALGGLMSDATLRKVTERTTDGRGGFTSTTVDHACRAIVTEYSDAKIAFSNGVIGALDRRAIVIALSLTAEPAMGDVFVTGDDDWSVMSVTKDPAGATFELQLRPI